MQHRKCILSEIIIDEKEEPQIKLLEYGLIVEKYINNINQIYDDIEILNYTIMPNHIHFICAINAGKRNKTKTTERIPFLISTLKRLTNNEIGERIWQRNYCEHIIRNEKEFIEINQYIEYNKFDWKKDEYFV